MKKYLPVVISLTFIPSPVFSDVWTFETPSENVQCVVGQEIGVLSDISCTIIEKSGPPAKPRPNSCQEGWGHTFSMRENGPVEMICQYPSMDKNAFDRADYGVTGNFGGFTCHSSTKGLKCTNRDGNGFFLSRRHQYVIGTYRDSQGSTQAAVSEDQKSADIGNYPVWGAEFGQGIVEASVGDGNGSELRLVCNISGLDTIASKLSFGPQTGVPSFASAGSTVEFLFDGLHSAPILLNADDSFVVEKDAVSIGTFNFLIGRLKKHSFVVIKLPDGQQLNFSLRGSSKAIGVCPPTPSTHPVQTANTTSDQSSSLPNQPVAHSRAQFSDYPAIADLRSNAKYPDFGGRDRNFKTYRTRIRNGIDQGVNFAGHYTFIVIGCGTECIFGFVVDLRTGEVFDFPYGGEEQYQMDLQFTENSRLVKVRWKGDWQSSSCTEKDLLVEGTSWRVLSERETPTNGGLCHFPFEDQTEQQLESQTKNSTAQQDPSVVSNSSAMLEEDSIVPNHALDWLKTENYLFALGFLTEEPDGFFDAATLEAIGRFQQTYALEANSPLTAQQFKVLEALAANKKNGNHDNSASNQGTQSQSEIISQRLKIAYDVRGQILSSPKTVLDLLTETLLPDSSSILYEPGAFERMLSGAIPYVGCGSEDLTAFGFYNVGQNNWFIVWLDLKTGQVRATRFSSGFEPKDRPENIAWFDLYSPNGSVLGAMQEAVRIQTEAFTELFPEKGCLESHQMDRVFSGSKGLASFSEATTLFGKEDPVLITEMKTRIRRGYELPEETELVTAVIVPKVLGFDRLSVFVSKKNPAMIFAQGWQIDDDKLTLLSRDASLLIPEEQE